MRKGKEIISDLTRRYPLLKSAERDIVRACELMESRFRNGGKLLIAGNGGSAADAEHIVGELMKGSCLDASFSAKLQAMDADKGAFLAERLQSVLPAMALTGNVALAAAIGNDVGGDLVFAQQLCSHGRAGDVFLGISTSGNSRNVVCAAIVAKAKGMSVIGLTGAHSGELAGYADVCVKVPETETHKVRELHLPICHSWCLALENAFFHEDESGGVRGRPESVPAALSEYTGQIRAVVFDMDGVLTDGKVYVGADGKESKAYCLRDVDALNEMKRRAYLTACITGEADAFAEHIREKFTPDEFHPGCKDKLSKLKEFERRHRLKAENICYIGDGKYDVQAMQHAGLRLCPADASERIKNVANVILECRGGEACLEKALSYLISICER